MKISTALALSLTIPFTQKTSLTSVKAAESNFFNWQDFREPDHQQKLEVCLKKISFTPTEKLLTQRGKSQKNPGCKSQQCFLDLLAANKAVILKKGDFSEGVILILKQAHLNPDDQLDIENNDGINVKKNLPFLKTIILHQQSMYCFLKDLEKALGKRLLTVVPENSPKHHPFNIDASTKQQFKLEGEIPVYFVHILNTFSDFFGDESTKSREEVMLAHTAAFMFLATSPRIPVLASYGEDCFKMTKVLVNSFHTDNPLPIDENDWEFVSRKINLEFPVENQQQFFKSNYEEIKSRVEKSSFNCRDEDIISQLVDAVQQADKTCSINGSASLQIPKTAVYTVGFNHNISDVIELNDNIKQFKGVIYEIPVPQQTKSDFSSEFFLRKQNQL
ncbi:MAG: hypothetical protein V4629_00835 [Pseudomonadota bacterium]